LEEQVRQLAAQLTSEAYTRQKTASQLKKREAEIRNLTCKLGDAQQELSALHDFQAKLPEGEVTLKKLQERFLRAQTKEIESRTRKRVKELSKGIESQMPALVEKEFRRVLNSPNWPPEIEKAVSTQAAQVADNILRNKMKWPDWFKDYFIEQLEEVLDKQLNEEFEDRVNAEAQNRLEAISTGHWEQFSAEKVRQLSTDLRAMASQLQGEWRFTCDRCQRRISLEIGPTEMAQLLEDRAVDVMCSSCLDPAPPPFILSVVPHKVASLALADLLRGYLGTDPPAG